MKKFIAFIAAGFGLGYMPVASGTFGSLIGVALAYGFAFYGWIWQIAICILMTGVAIPICTIAENVFGKKDDSKIVADEYLTFPICLIGIPWLQHLWILPVAFVIARIFDIIKPYPANDSQRLKGGLGIVADDVFASIYALAFNHAIYAYFIGYK